jgi:hypothetical protein
MANRSNLYAANTLPSAGSHDLPAALTGVSTHNWSIPLAHLLLVSFDTRVVPSMIWDERIGVAGDYDRGAALLMELLRVVGEDPYEAQDFEKVAAATKVHLERQRAKYFLLEAGEILFMDQDPLEESFDRLVGHHIPFLAAQAEAAIAGENEEWLTAARFRWRENFYSSFEDTPYFPA